ACAFDREATARNALHPPTEAILRRPVTTVDHFAPRRHRRIVVAAGQSTIPPSSRPAASHEEAPAATARPVEAAKPGKTDVASTDVAVPEQGGDGAGTLQRLVRYTRRSTPAVEPARTVPRTSVRRLGSGHVRARPLETDEELLVAVAVHLGFDVRAI